MDTGRRILVPLDHSPLAEAVVPRAAALARATGYGLTLFEVVTPEAATFPPGWPAGAPVVVYDVWATEARSQASEYLTTVARRLTAQGLNVSMEVQLEDDIAAAIIARARHDSQVAMIAMSTHGRSGFARLLFGSVAERVLHDTPVPLLLTRASDKAIQPQLESTSYTTILVPLDGSQFAEQALSQARQIAVATHADLVLTTVVPLIDDTGLAEGGVEPYWMLAERRFDADRQIYYLDRVVKQLTAEGLHARVRIVHGDPGPAILQAALEEQTSLIVMTTHGRSGLQRIWLGSVANQVVRGSVCPVLLLRTSDIRTNTAAETDEAVVEKR